MSLRLFPDDLKFEQRLLKSAGFYKGKIDGRYGPLTMAAEDASQKSYEELQSVWGFFDTRSERNIITLLPKMQVKARQIMKMANNAKNPGWDKCVILSGTRTYAEQDVLFEKRPKVTNARGGQSNHNFGIALDVGLFKGGKYLTGATRAENKAYADLAALVKKNVSDIEAGIDWKSFPDAPHYQYATGRQLAQVRNAFEVGALALA